MNSLPPDEIPSGNGTADGMTRRALTTDVFEWSEEALKIMNSAANSITAFVPHVIYPTRLQDHEGYKSMHKKSCLASIAVGLITSLYEGFSILAESKNFSFVRIDLDSMEQIGRAAIELHKSIKKYKNPLITPNDDEFTAFLLFSALHAVNIVIRLRGMI